MQIKQIIAREILDSRGNPTVAATVVLQNNIRGSAQVPSGASTGTHEALELRDGGSRYGGRGVLKAVKNVNSIIAKKIVGRDIEDFLVLDKILLDLDGTPNKSKLGANAILSVSLAAARAAAAQAQQPLYVFLREVFTLQYKNYRLPIPMMNILNGGRHADNGLSIQEFMIIPRHKLMRERIRMGAQVFHALGKILSQKGYATAVGDEGGFAPELANNERGLQLIMTAIKEAGFVAGKNIFLGLDVAASEFFTRGQYYFSSKKQGQDAIKMIANYAQWIKKYPLIAIEDGLAEDDWVGWRQMTQALPNTILVGDDLFVTNATRLERGVQEHAANAVLIKLNQVGTLLETINAIKIAQKNHYQIAISHRSGDTGDTFIADLAVAVNAEFIKTGSLSRAERTEKYNRLMEIEEELNHYRV